MVEHAFKRHPMMDQDCTLFNTHRALSHCLSLYINDVQAVPEHMTSKLPPAGMDMDVAPLMVAVNVVW